jgi:hypothetical protein
MEKFVTVEGLISNQREMMTTSNIAVNPMIVLKGAL